MTALDDPDFIDDSTLRIIDTNYAMRGIYVLSWGRYELLRLDFNRSALIEPRRARSFAKRIAQILLADAILLGLERERD